MLGFTISEFSSRSERCQQALQKLGVDYAVVLEPESVTYLTGFYTDGYQTSFQAAIVPPDAPPFTIVRRAERYYFDTTAAWPDRCIEWLDGETEADVLLRALREVGAEGRIGVEGHSWRAKHSVIQALASSWGTAELVDISKDLAALRFIKSPAEIEYHRRAGAASVAALRAAVATIAPGSTEADVALAASAAAVRAGSQEINPGPVAAGERARHIHALFADGVIQQDDVLFLEMDASVRTYHTRFMRTVVVGDAPRGLPETYRHFVDVQDEAIASVRPGVSCRVPDAIYRKGVLDTRWVDSYPNKTFYSVGSLLFPNTYEPLEVTPESDFVFEQGMVFHTYLSAKGVNVSECIVVTANGAERITDHDRELIVC